MLIHMHAHARVRVYAGKHACEPASASKLGIRVSRSAPCTVRSSRRACYTVPSAFSQVDYDAIESMDAELVNEHINTLLTGAEVMAPVYDMKTGYRKEPGTPFQLPLGGMLIIEGIHALNPDFLKVPVCTSHVHVACACPQSGLAQGACVDVTCACCMRVCVCVCMANRSPASCAPSTWTACPPPIHSRFRPAASSRSTSRRSHRCRWEAHPGTDRPALLPPPNVHI